MMKLRNLTPHAINIYIQNNDTDWPVIYTIPAEGVVPRVIYADAEIFSTVDVGEMSINIFKAGKVSHIEDLPPVETGVLLIVSRLVAATAAARDDLVFPDGLVRNKEGKIIGCRHLTCIN